MKDVAQPTPVPQIPIVFFGTPDFSATILSGLIDTGYRIVGVVTRADKPTGRLQETISSAVKEVAVKNHIPILQPQKIDAEALAAIAAWKPDLILVAAYGRILPEKLLRLPGLGCINVHPSLLPRWRGASPIQNTLLAGDDTTGVTLMLMDEGVDTGDIIAQESITLDPHETSALLTPRLATLSLSLLTRYLPDWIKRRITPQPQPTEGITLCQLIEREDGRIFWNTPAEDLYNRYRGLTPWPGVFTFWKRGDDLLRLKLITLGFQRTDPAERLSIGTVIEIGEKIGVQTGSGVIFLEVVQLEGKTPLPIREFLNGNQDFLGATLV